MGLDWFGGRGCFGYQGFILECQGVSERDVYVLYVFLRNVLVAGGEQEGSGWRCIEAVYWRGFQDGGWGKCGVKGEKGVWKMFDYFFFFGLDVW